ncbi:MAG: tRNA lysidine(34) synthetase TilS, partial [Propionibacteriaceae bacterium]
MARRALGPATLMAVQAVRASLQPSDHTLLVACSGGADSLALAAATLHVSRSERRSAAALVVDHGLQPGSARTAAGACEQLERLGYEDVRVAAVSVDLAAGLGVEAAAREARYRALDEEAETRDATVLLGHTLDDQAETVLLGLARGSGTRSLSGMASRSGRHLRPLLSLRRETTERVCAELELDVWDDPHNADDSYARSRVRSRILPLLEAELGPGIAEALARTAELSRLDADLLDQLAGQLHPVTDTLDCDTLDCGTLAEAPAA